MKIVAVFLIQSIIILYSLNAQPKRLVDLVEVLGGELQWAGGKGIFVKTFYLSRTEITCSQYCDFLNASGVGAEVPLVDNVPWFINYGKSAPIYYDSRKKEWAPKQIDITTGAGFPKSPVSAGPYPMIEVSWYGAEAYCKFYSGRLPTEAEWEYAARGGKNNPKATVEKYAGSDNPSDVAWCKNNSNSPGCYILNIDNLDTEPPMGTHPVGTKKPNILGLYDMTGNVFEWCDDYIDDTVRGDHQGEWKPQAVSKTIRRAMRGGAWWLVFVISERGAGLIKMDKNRAMPTMNSGLGFRFACDQK